MSFTLKAPYPNIETITIMPSPQFGNSEGRIQSLNIKRSITGVIRTYVKKGTMPNGRPRSRMQWQFLLTRNKAIELLEFTKSYHSSQIQIFDHVNREYRGYIMNNPLEISPVQRGAPEIQELQGELCEVTIDFEGEALDPPRAPVIQSVSARNKITTFQQSPNLIPAFPNVYGTKYHWDAYDLSLNIGDRVETWAANANASQNVSLVKHPGGTLNYTLPTPASHNYSPYYVRNIIGANLPSVYFGNTISSVQVNAAMRSASTVNFWPNKQGTVIWVQQHHIGTPPGSGYRFFQLSTEFGVWSLRRTSDYRPIDGFQITGGAASWWPPATWRSTGTSGDTIDSPTLNSANPTITPSINPNVLARGRPYIMTLQRNGTNIRYRLNGTEFPGRTINNYPSVNGYFTFGLTVHPLTGYTATMRGCLGQFIVWDRILSNTEIETIETYLSEKWNTPLELWEHTDDCFPDWCLSFPNYCSGSVNSYTPNFTGVPETDFEAANIVKGQPPQYGSCCGDV